MDNNKNSKSKIVNPKEVVIDVVDQNGNDEIDIEDIIILGLHTPGIKVDRSDFLRKELQRYYPEDVIDDAIEYNPAHANITPADLEKISEDVIQYERYFVSGISAALGTPGGVAMVATIPADIAQYYAYMLRATQKLLYLYGFQQIDTDEKEHTFDSGTLNTLILCLGVMYGVAGANAALTSLAKSLGEGVEKKLLQQALTKGTIFPIVKNIAKWFNVNLTKSVFAGFFKKSIPVVGGVVGGGITYLTFKPCCEKLKNTLKDTILSNPDHLASSDEEDLSDGIMKDLSGSDE